MVGEFKNDRVELGGRLAERRGSGLTAMQRRYVTIEESENLRPKAHRDIEWSEPAREVRRSGPKGGRPRTVGDPWVAAGISRTEYYRRKKSGGV
jgi:hypothetical protein